MLSTFVARNTTVIYRAHGRPLLLPSECKKESWTNMAPMYIRIICTGLRLPIIIKYLYTVCNSYSTEVSVIREIQYEAHGVERSILHEVKPSTVL